MPTATDIFTMELNEVLQLGDAYWRRVPGGWIVTETYEDPGSPPGSSAMLRLHPVYVPEPLGDAIQAIDTQAKFTPDTTHPNHDETEY